MAGKCAHAPFLVKMLLFRLWVQPAVMSSHGFRAVCPLPADISRAVNSNSFPCLDIISFLDCFLETLVVLKIPGQLLTRPRLKSLKCPCPPDSEAHIQLQVILATPELLPCDWLISRLCQCRRPTHGQPEAS